MYIVKELFYTLQGEGANMGRPAVFCRFSGCNLWTGRENDRSTAACRFCDTDFVGTNGAGGGEFRNAGHLSQAILDAWPGADFRRKTAPFVVCTGGEPLLQLDEALVDALHDAGFTIAIETNGTLEAPNGVDWVCVSPKAGTELRMRSGDELKLVFPQAGAEPAHFEGLGFNHFFIQPMDGPSLEENTKLAVKYCLRHPQWRLSLQMHKMLGIQ